MNKFKTNLYGFFLLILIFSIFQNCNNDEPSSNLEYDKEGKVISPLESLKRKQIEESLNDSFEYISTITKLDNYSFNTDEGIKGTNILSDCYTFYLKRKAKSNYKELNSKMVSLIVEKQVKYLPIMRNNFSDFMSKELWEENIKVSISGKTITFIGGRYASNKLVKEDMDAMNKTINQLKFKKVIFKWIPSDDDYVSYLIQSTEDNIPIN